MNRLDDPVVVLEARNEFEAQAARDTLLAAAIPVLHVPSLSTGIFGVPTSTRVAVPRDRAEEAVLVLQEAGFTPSVHDPRRGLAAVSEAARDKLGPLGHPTVTLGGHLGRAMLVVAAIILLIIALALWRGR